MNTAKEFNLKNIRNLLNGFTESELRNKLCYEHPDFRLLHSQLAQSDSLADVVDRVIQYADRRLLFESLLAWAKEHNPSAYELYEPYRATTSGPSKSPPFAETSMGNDMKDVFICHAGEDKPTVVRPLAKAFKENGITCWLDEGEIRWGDSITKKVNEGLSGSRYVIVVLSQAFLTENWPQRELHAVLNMEASSGGVKILPLLVGDKVTIDAIMEKFPLINDKFYLIWENNPEPIVNALKMRLNRS